MSRRDRRGSERASRETQPAHVVAPESLPVATHHPEEATTETSGAALPVEPVRAPDHAGTTFDASDAIEPAAAPPERPAQFVARIEIRHNRVRYSAGAEIPAAVAEEMLACGLLLGLHIAAE